MGGVLVYGNAFGNPWKRWPCYRAHRHVNCHRVLDGYHLFSSSGCAFGTFVAPVLADRMGVLVRMVPGHAWTMAKKIGKWEQVRKKWVLVFSWALSLRGAKVGNPRWVSPSPWPLCCPTHPPWHGRCICCECCTKGMKQWAWRSVGCEIAMNALSLDGRFLGRTSWNTSRKAC